jgi:carbonic anhydrase/acetyltransferase-like protein (isoleucine patch superfamily)
MLLSHLGRTPQIEPGAYVAPTATVCGDVTIGPHCRIMHGASVVAEGGRIEIGACCIVMENAVVRSTTRHSTRIGRHCLIGPNAHLVGCVVEDEVFIATGAAIFHGAHLGKGSEVRSNAVVHIESRLPLGETVPIGWIAVGDPIRILPPDQHEAIWAVQKPLNFPLVMYGLDRVDADMVKVTQHLSDVLAPHMEDSVVSS